VTAEDSETEVWLIRHGETEWSKSGQHTGTSDLPLTAVGEEAARALRPFLARTSFDRVLSSPLQRARRTAELAGVDNVEIDDDLLEWDYGHYEGLTRVQVRERQPGWSIWSAGAPGGESPEEVTARVDRVIEKLRRSGGRILLFAHGHILRALAVRWIEQDVGLGVHLPLDTAKVSVLSYDRGTPSLGRWNCDPTQ
jgi:broad specificity phosphatase PhoE